MTVSDSALLNLPWFVLKVRARSEPAAISALQSRGYRPFSPTYGQRKRYSDRVKLVDTPLFPGYVFCQFDPQSKSLVLGSPAVQYILGTSQGPISLSHAEIEAIDKMAKAGAKPMEFLQHGQRARIHFGPLRGLEGIVTKVKAGMRLVLSVEFMRRSIFVDVDFEQLDIV